MFAQVFVQNSRMINIKIQERPKEKYQKIDRLKNKFERSELNHTTCAETLVFLRVHMCRVTVRMIIIQ